METDPAAMTRAIVRCLEKAASPVARKAQERFFKEPFKSYGMPMAAVRAISKDAIHELRKRGGGREEALAVGERLWPTGMHEARLVAIELLRPARMRPGREDWRRLDRWTGGLANWAETDGFCIYVLGPLLLREPDLVPKLRPWTRSRHRWRRRSSAVALIPAVRRGLLLDEAFRTAGVLAPVRDDMVEKAAGWLLKEATKKAAGEVVAFLQAHRNSFSRLSLRYASEKLTPDMKALVLDRPRA